MCSYRAIDSAESRAAERGVVCEVFGSSMERAVRPAAAIEMLVVVQAGGGKFKIEVVVL